MGGSRGRNTAASPLFKKLRNRFLIVNLTTIVVIMLVAFASIYIITYRQVQSEISMDLDRTAGTYRNGGNSPFHQDGGGNSGTNSLLNGSTKPPAGAFGENGPPDRSVSFMMRTDSSGALTETQSRFSSLTEDFYASALKQAQSLKRDRSEFTLDGSRWTFMRIPSDNGAAMYVFIDTTSRQEILTTLIYTFLAVGLAMLIVLFFFSRFFANRSIRPVREAFEKQKQFIGDASHELKTPLAVINTNADVLLANGDETIRSQEKWLRYIKSETERMAKLTGDLLYLTEMDDSRPGMVQARFDLSDAVENVMLTMEAVVFEKNLTLDYEIEPGLELFGSREQIVQVTMILLDNAIKYANPRGSITLSLKREHSEIRLAVSNTGEGIAAEHLPHVFDRFYRTDKSRTRSQGGHGLGLAIAKSIVEQHKGRIAAKSTVGEKTTFTVYFPA